MLRSPDLDRPTPRLTVSCCRQRGPCEFVFSAVRRRRHKDPADGQRELVKIRENHAIKLTGKGCSVSLMGGQPVRSVDPGGLDGRGEGPKRPTK